MTTPTADTPQNADNTNAHTQGDEKITIDKAIYEQLLKERDEHLAGWKRAHADYQNIQKETAKRMSDNIKYATEAFLMELLPMVDHFTYAFKGIPENERASTWLKGIEHIQTNFMRILQEHGVEVIPTVGTHFNPELHESAEEVDAEGVASGEVVEELAKGFLLNGKVIKPAHVKIAK